MTGSNKPMDRYCLVMSLGIAAISGCSDHSSDPEHLNFDSPISNAAVTKSEGTEEDAPQGILLGDGNACANNGQCSSGFCVDNVCCNSSCASTCMACTAAKKGSGKDGFCSNIAVMTDPDNECPAGECNGSGACGSPAGMAPNGTACGSDATCASGFCVDGVCCEEACTTTCMACSSAKKGNGADGICGKIIAGADPDAECKVGACNGTGACASVIQLGVGSSCASNAQCGSGFCVSGVCCNNTCSGQCDACNVPGSMGVCTNICSAGPCSTTLSYAGPPLDEGMPLPGGNYYIDSADFNGDGFQDLVATNVNQSSPQKVTVLTNQGNGSFATSAQFTVSIMPLSTSAADLNNDGFPDFAVAYGMAGGVGVFLNQGNGTFGSPVDYQTNTVQSSSNAALNLSDLMRIADVNGDGIKDIVSAAMDSNLVTLLFGQGNGTFPTSVDLTNLAKPLAVAVADFNNDSIADLAVTTSDGTTNYRVSILVGQGAGAFASPVHYPVGFNAMSMATADLNGDGMADIVAAQNTYNRDGKVFVLLNQGNGTFGNPTAYDTQGAGRVVIADVNGDSIMDLLVATERQETLDVLPGLGNGTFAGSTRYTMRFRTNGLVATDVDNDNDQDVVMSSWNTLSILKNSGNGNFGRAVGSTPILPMTADIIRSGDLNGDGLTDLIGIGPSGLQVAFGQGSSGLGPVISIPDPSTFHANYAKLTDLNGDGHLDILYVREGIRTRLNQGNGTFAPAINSGNDRPYKLIFEDFNVDGIVDIAYSWLDINYWPPPSTFHTESIGVSIGYGNGTGAFGSYFDYPVGGTGMINYSVGDDRLIPIVDGYFNSDGLLDLLISDYHLRGERYLYNTGNGQVQQLWQTSQSLPSASQDPEDVSISYVGYAYQDWQRVQLSGVMTIMSISNGTVKLGSASLAATSWPTDVQLIDLDGDGLRELTYAGGGSHSASVHRNNGNDTFGLRKDYLAGGFPTSMAVGDWNNDGALDIAVQNSLPNNVSLLYGGCIP